MVDTVDKVAIVNELQAKVITDFCDAFEPQIAHLSWPASTAATAAHAGIAALRKRATDLAQAVG